MVATLKRLLPLGIAEHRSVPKRLLANFKKAFRGECPFPQMKVLTMNGTKRYAGTLVLAILFSTVSVALPQEAGHGSYTVRIPEVTKINAHVGLWIVEPKTAEAFMQNEIAGRPKRVKLSGFKYGVNGTAITIPHGKKVFVLLSGDDSAPAVRTEFLDQFDKESIFFLAIAFAWIDKESLKPLKKHKELRLLSLTSPYSLKDNDALSPLAEMPWIRALSIDKAVPGIGDPITDGDMKYVGQIAALRYLNLAGLRIGDRGVQDLAGLQKLRTLDLAATQLTDEGICHLTRLPRLTILRIGGTRVTDKGLALLVGLRHLEELSLHHTEISGKTLVYLSKLSKLRVLDLSSTRVTDEEFRRFGHKNLRRLMLNNTSLSERALERLPERFPRLEELQIVGTYIHPDFVTHLKRLKKTIRVVVKQEQIPKKPLEVLGEPK